MQSMRGRHRVAARPAALGFAVARPQFGRPSMIHFEDELLDGQLLRTVGHATYGAAEIGECLRAAGSIDPRDRETWRSAWFALAERTRSAAEHSAASGHRVSARHAFLRASNYYRNAYILHLEAPFPAVAKEAYLKHRAAFAEAATLWPTPIERIAIPFEGRSMPGWFCVAPGGGIRPLVISVGGYDSTAEESVLWNAIAANERGYHALTFDGPGQGAMLIEHGIPFRPDWEVAISAAIDAMASRGDVDTSKIALIAESLGGYLALGAAARDRRIAACVLDPPQPNLFRAALARIPLPEALKTDLPHGPAWLVAILRTLLTRRARALGAGWPLRRGMLTHGSASPWDYFIDTRRYDHDAQIAAIRCPTLVCAAERDDLTAYAASFFERLTCDKTYVAFTAAEGAGEHCEIGNRSLMHERTFDWLDGRLGGVRP
jgi:pimeloyl-ACP methyl ester carboxylesterase